MRLTGFGAKKSDSITRVEHKAGRPMQPTSRPRKIAMFTFHSHSCFGSTPDSLQALTRVEQAGESLILGLSDPTQ